MSGPLRCRWMSPVAALMLAACTEAKPYRITTPGPEGPGCEVVVHELADADEAVPWGPTGADVLALLPDQASVGLMWSVVDDEVELEIPGLTGDSTQLQLSFDESEPRFRWHEAIDLVLGDETWCGGSLEVEVRYSMSSSDGVVQVQDMPLSVYLYHYGAYEDETMLRASTMLDADALDVAFVAPEMLMPSEVNLLLLFSAGQVSEGHFFARAERERSYGIKFGWW